LFSNFSVSDFSSSNLHFFFCLLDSLTFFSQTILISLGGGLFLFDKMLGSKDDATVEED
jgi:hypothetical protein